MAEANHLDYILSILNHAGTIGVNWERVAAENNIGYARNATQKFKDTVVKYGYTFQRNKLVKTEHAAPETPDATKKKTTPRKSANKKSSAASKPIEKKRKLDNFDESENSDDDMGKHKAAAKAN